jgi:hypothetical protein
MSELAFNLNGDPFEVPPNAVGWRVRKMKNKGAPEVAYGRNGQPLVLPLEADVDDLRAEVGTPGRYRLDPIDDTNKPIANAPAGYVYVHDIAPAAPSAAGAIVTPLAPLPSPSENVVVEAMRMNAEIARAVVDRFPQMLEAAATLLRAADGAGLPAREPRGDADDELDGDDEDDDAQHGPKPAFDLNALVAQIIPMIVMGIGNGKMPQLAEVLDWRKAAPAAKPKAPKQSKAARPDGPGDASTPTVQQHDVPENATDVLPPIDPQTMAHFIAVQSALTPEEGAIARDVAKELGAAELRAWFDELSKLSVPEAVAKVRKLISGFGKEGGAS